MEKILTPYRFLQLILAFITWTGMNLNGFDYESVMLYVFISLLGNLFLILCNSGLISTKFILSFLIYSIALVPGIAYHLLDFKLYSYVNFSHQLNDTVTIEMLWLMFMSSNLYTFVLLARDTSLPDISTPIKNETRLPYYFMCFLILFLTFVGNPEPTIITIGYQELYHQRSSISTLASIAATVFWVDAYGKTRVFLNTGQHYKIKLFWFITFIMITWLLLHARRTEAIGVISILLIHTKITTGKTPYKMIAFALLVGLLLYIIGYVRSSALTSIDLVGTLQHAFQLSFEGGGEKIEFANMPSGLGNITSTMQTSVYHFHYLGEPLLDGYTMYTYPLKILPTLLVKSANLADPSTYFYHNLVLENYIYNGGTYIYAPSYGNFGTIGLMVASILTAMMVSWTQKSMRSCDYIKIVFAASVIFIFIRVCWYNFIPLPKIILYNAIVLFYVAMIFNKKRKPQIPTSNLTLPQVA